MRPCLNVRIVHELGNHWSWQRWNIQNAKLKRQENENKRNSGLIMSGLGPMKTLLRWCVYIPRENGLSVWLHWYSRGKNAVENDSFHRLQKTQFVYKKFTKKTFVYKKHNATFVTSQTAQCNLCYVTNSTMQPLWHYNQHNVSFVMLQSTQCNLCETSARHYVRCPNPSRILSQKFL